jgi:hypothetical protein
MLVMPGHGIMHEIFRLVMGSRDHGYERSFLEGEAIVHPTFPSCFYRKLSLYPFFAYFDPRGRVAGGGGRTGRA